MTQDSHPLVSVVVPTYKRPDLLERCLSALSQQVLAPEEYEIIVCDDGPSEQARAVAQAAAALCKGQLAIRYFAVSMTQGPAGARNVGWKAAVAPIVAFTDDDTVPEPDWLQAGIAAMTPGVDAVAGRIIMPLPERPTDYHRDAARLSDAEFVTANCFVRREALVAVGGFDERYTQAWREDSDLQFSLLQHGYTVVRAAQAMVVHPMRAASFAAGVGMQKKVMFDVLLYRKFTKLYRERIRQHPPWFYMAVTTSLLSALVSFLAGWHSVALVASWLWAVLSAGFFILRLRASSLGWRNVGELLITSLLIPPLSIFWRVVGVARFGWGFP